MDKMTTGMARTIRSASSGIHGVVGRSPPAKAAGAAALVSDRAPPDLDVLPEAPLPVAPVWPVEPVAAEPKARVAPAEPPDVAAPETAPPEPGAGAPGALPIGGSGGGDAPAPRLPLKVGLLQLEALSCCAGW